VADLDYALPDELIAQAPPPNREDARMLILDRRTSGLRNSRITEIPEALQPGDLLVLNNTRVLPAKFTAIRAGGGKTEGLFLSEYSRGCWNVLLRGSQRLRVGQSLALTGSGGEVVTLTLRASAGRGQWHGEVDADEPAAQILQRLGRAPLPPYIARKRDNPTVDAIDHDRYQTVYAKIPGAVAAPTAGLHFTKDLLGRIRRRGIRITFLTLHVGLGTFKPITVEDLSQHAMHEEYFELTDEAAEAVNDCRRRGGRVVAVGTTSVRALESAASLPGGVVSPGRGTTAIFIYPPYEFRVVDALLTNFHLPKSTLLALVMALAGVDQVRTAYAHAINHRYRFYSYGDAMFVQ